MFAINSLWLNLAVALGIGLLIGAERERNKGEGPGRSPAGIRTFAIATLLGAVSYLIHFWLFVISICCVMIFSVTAYFSKHNEDPGLTTEITLIFTVILGGLAMTKAPLAAAIAVIVTILLKAKEPIHGFVLKAITKEELNDFLILSAASLIILPLVPNQAMGPFEAINPYNLWLIVILIMTIGALGHLALRSLGGKIGLPVVGLISGFISSVATISTLGERAKETPHLIKAAAAGAVLSSLATIFQLTMLLITIDPPTLQALQWPLVFGGVTIAIYGAIITIQSFKNSSNEVYKPTKPFSIKTAISFTAVIALILLTSATLKHYFGQTGLLVASSIAGFADVHASAISVASLVSNGKISAENAVTPILLALSFNTFSKAIMAFISGGKNFALLVIPALMIQVAAVWIAWWWLY